MVNQNVKIYLGSLANGSSVDLPLSMKRFGWLQLISGQIELDGHLLSNGDGIQISEVETPSITAREDSRFLFFDLH